MRLELPAEQDSYAVEVLGTAVLALTSTTGPTVRMFLNNEITPCNSASLPASSPTGFVEIQALACSFALSAGEKALVRLEAIGGAPQYSRLKARYDSP